jgi:ABC-type amino acid transport substrate-binding protein
MQKILAMILVALMVLSVGAYAAKDVVKRGALEMDGEGLFVSAEHKAHRQKEDGVSSEVKYERVNYNNLSSALMDMQSGKIIKLSLTESVANYVAAHNDNFTVVSNTDNLKNFSMMTTDSNKEVYDILNNAIKDMKADGTLDALIENDLKAYIESDPEAKDLPHFDGAKTIKIGVTGDLPPMDFVAANGKAAGFNISLLTEIANRVQVNFELVQIESSARAMALSSGKVDAVFWTKSVTCSKCNESWGESIDDTLVTESYFTDKSAFVVLKSEK